MKTDDDCNDGWDQAEPAVRSQPHDGHQDRYGLRDHGSTVEGPIKDVFARRTKRHSGSKRGECKSDQNADGREDRLSATNARRARNPPGKPKDTTDKDSGRVRISYPAHSA